MKLSCPPTGVLLFDTSANQFEASACLHLPPPRSFAACRMDYFYNTVSDSNDTSSWIVLAEIKPLKQSLKRPFLSPMSEKKHGTTEDSFSQILCALLTSPSPHIRD